MPRNFSHAGIKSGFWVNFSVANGHAEKYMACRKKYKALILKKVPCILKYMACIFRHTKCLIHNNLRKP